MLLQPYVYVYVYVLLPFLHQARCLLDRHAAVARSQHWLAALQDLMAAGLGFKSLRALGKAAYLLIR